MKTINTPYGQVKYVIIRKPIKNLYLRLKDDVIYVTCNKQWHPSVIETYVSNHYPKLKRRAANKKSKPEVPKYMLSGIEYVRDNFYQVYNLEPIEKNYLKVLANNLDDRIAKLNPIIQEKLAILGLKEVPITYKKLTSKYGSCKIQAKTITLNLFLARLSDEFLEYVIIHEYAHLIIPNHSAKFYEVLDLVYDDHKKIQRNLRKHVISF